MRVHQAAVLCLALAIYPAGLSLAQETRASIAGTVTNARGLLRL